MDLQNLSLQFLNFLVMSFQFLVFLDQMESEFFYFFQ